MSVVVRMRRYGIAAGLVVAAGLMATSAHAQLTTFAEFGKSAKTPTGGFQFTNSGSSSSFGVLNGSIPINFQYDTTNGYDGSGYNTIAATMSITANASGPAMLSGSTVTQSLSSFTMSITAVNPVNGVTNLLTTNFSTSDGSVMYLTGTDAGGAATINVSNAGAGGVSDYTSDFLNFGTGSGLKFTNEQFAISLSGVINTGGGIGMTINNSNGYLDSFGGNGTGTFASNPVPPGKTPTAVPEPTSIALAGLSLLGVVGYRRRKRSALGR